MFKLSFYNFFKILDFHTLNNVQRNRTPHSIIITILIHINFSSKQASPYSQNANSPPHPKNSLQHLVQNIYNLPTKKQQNQMMQQQGGILDVIVKILPIEPLNNSALLIYCILPNGQALPFKPFWSKICPENNKFEIQNHEGSSYRCCAFDIDFIIEVKVFYQINKVQMSKVVRSRPVKLCHELKDLKLHCPETVNCKISYSEIFANTVVVFGDDFMRIVPTKTSYQQNNQYVLKYEDFQVQVELARETVKINIEKKCESFMEFLTKLLGWRPKIMKYHFIFHFQSVIIKDLFLLFYLSWYRNLKKKSFPIANKIEPKIATELKEKQQPKQDSFIKNNHHKSHSSLSSVNSSNSKIKKSAKTMKKSIIKKSEPTEPDEKRQCLNIFQEEELEFLERFNTTPNTPTNPYTPIVSKQSHQFQDEPSLNLRNSFEELQKTFNNQLNSHKKNQNKELERLKNENQILKKSEQQLKLIKKQNMNLKKIYLQVKQENDKLQAERQAQLTKILRSQLHLKKEQKQKQLFKTQLENIKTVLRRSNISIESLQQKYRQRSITPTYLDHQRK